MHAHDHYNITIVADITYHTPYVNAAVHVYINKVGCNQEY